MAVGKFKLQVKRLGQSEACVGVQYRILSNGAVVAQGKTDAVGETAGVVAPEDGMSCKLEVLNCHTGEYEAPDQVGVYGIPLRPSLDVLGSESKQVQVETVSIKPYFRVKFYTQSNARPIPQASYTAYEIDSKGRKVVARDLDRTNPIKGVTNAAGETDVIYSSSPLIFEFTYPGSPIKTTSRMLEPLLKGCKVTRLDLPFKTIAAQTVPVGQDPATKVGGVVGVPILISPADSELLAVPQSAYEEFEAVSGMLEKIIGGRHQAHLELSKALDSGNLKQIEAAEKALGVAEDKVKKELNENFSKLADLKEVVTYEHAIDKTGTPSGGALGKLGLRRRYIKKDLYDKLSNARLNKKEYKIALNFKVGPLKAGVKVAPETLDVNALKESFSKISKELSMSLKADPKVYSLLDEAASQFSDALVRSSSIEVDAHAQWLRMIMGAGASASASWDKKKFEVQGNLQGKLALCEGKTTITYATPSLKGWLLQLAGEDLGAIRACVTCEFYGFAGAKVVAGAALGVSLDGVKQVVQGIQKKPAKSLAQQASTQHGMAVLDPLNALEPLPKDLNGVKLDVEAFAGAEAGITLGGNLQWLPPGAKDFDSFASVSTQAGGSAGVGFGGALYIYLDAGKFRIRVAASVCFGVGGKGAVEFEVNAEKILSFARWVSSLLLHAGFKKLLFFAEDAFMAFSQLLVLLIKEGIKLDTGASEEQAKNAPSVKRVEEITRQIASEFDKLERAMNRAGELDKLVAQINTKPQWLVHATPEVRGMLLYQITRPGRASHTRDTPSFSANLVELNPDLHLLPSHKEAILNIMKCVQTAKSWADVMQHMTVDGRLSKKSEGENEGDVIRFLNRGLLLAGDVPAIMGRINASKDEEGSTDNKMLDDYLAMRKKLRKDFPKGYQVVGLDHPQLDVLLPNDGRRHIDFPVARG